MARHGLAPVAEEHINTAVFGIAASLITDVAGAIEAVAPGTWSCDRRLGSNILRGLSDGWEGRNAEN